MVNKSSYRSKEYHLVIEEFDKENDKSIREIDLNNALKSDLRVIFYAFIKHDSDNDIEGLKKRAHYHIMIVLNQPYAKSTIIHSLATSLECNVNIISARHINSFVKSVQYLIHKNDKDKFPYQVQDIWTSDLNEVYACLYQGCSTYEIDIDYLYELVKRSNSLAEIYRELGLEKAKRYRSLIADMYREEHLDRYL